MRDGATPPGDAVAPNAAGPRLASAILPVPSGATRHELRISGVQPGDRPLSVEICLARPGDPASWLSVGALAIGPIPGLATFPDSEPRFDVTAAIRALATPLVEVAVLPLALGPSQRSWPAFHYAGMAIVAPAA